MRFESLNLATHPINPFEVRPEMGDSINVLMIDDDVSLTALFDQFLETEGGFTFTACHDGESGVATAHNNGVRLTFLQMSMSCVRGQ